MVKKNNQNIKSQANKNIHQDKIKKTEIQKLNSNNLLNKNALKESKFYILNYKNLYKQNTPVICLQKNVYLKNNTKNTLNTDYNQNQHQIFQNKNKMQHNLSFQTNLNNIKNNITLKNCN